MLWNGSKDKSSSISESMLRMQQKNRISGNPEISTNLLEVFDIASRGVGLCQNVLPLESYLLAY